MSRVRQLIAVVLCLVLLSSTSQAWFGFGHMAVAYVAYQKLTAEKKARVRVAEEKPLLQHQMESHDSRRHSGGPT